MINYYTFILVVEKQELNRFVRGETFGRLVRSRVTLGVSSSIHRAGRKFRSLREARSVFLRIRVVTPPNYRFRTGGVQVLILHRVFSSAFPRWFLPVPSLPAPQYESTDDICALKIQSTISTRTCMLCEQLNVGLSTHKSDMAISSVEQRVLEALVLSKLVPEHYFHLC